MITVAGGDSFTWGSELSDHLHGGRGGHSRRTFPALLAQCHKSDYSCVAGPGVSNNAIGNNILFKLIASTEVLSQCVVIICWTWPTRDSGTMSRDIIARVEKVLVDIGVPYLFTCADNCLLEWLDDDTDWGHWFLFPPGEDWETPGPRGFYQWAVENKYPVGPEGHPLDQAHQDAANLMRGKFNEVVNKFIQQNSSGNTLS